MATLPEAKIQDIAIQFLHKRYRRHCFGRQVFSQAEVRTRSAYGGRRADGLLAFRHWLWGTYVISLEAKSMKTLPAIRPYRDQLRFLWNCLKAGLVGCLFSGAYMALVKMDDGLIQFSLPFNAMVAFAMGYALLTFNSFRHRSLEVVRQLQQYPANEQWLAFCSDSLEKLTAQKRDHLMKICKYRGIGLLIVKRRGGVKAVLKPNRRWKWRGDFLKYYSKEKYIRKIIGG